VNLSARIISSGHGRVFDALRLRFQVQVLLIVGLALLLRWYHIDRQSLWSDELFSRYYFDLFGFKYVWTTGFMHEDSPPLYYMAIAGWMRLFGTSEVAMRSLSVAASMFALPFVYMIGKELFDRQHGIVAMLVFALLPTQIAFAQEARTYALLLIPVGMMLLGIARFLRGDMRKRVLCLYGAGAILALYCHATAAFLIAACGIAVLAGVMVDRRVDRRTAMFRWICANAVVGLLALPELTAMLLAGRSGGGIAWIPPFGLGSVVFALTPVVTGVSTPVKFPGIELAVLLAAGLAWAILARPPGRRALIVLVAVPAIFVGLIATASLVKSIFITRVFCWLDIPLAVLLAYALTTYWRLRSAVMALVAVTCLVGLVYEFTIYRKEPWRELFDQIGPQLARADEVVLAPFTDPTPFTYYAPYLTRLQIWQPDYHLDTVENDTMPVRMGAQPISQADLINEIRSGKNVWLILRTPDLSYARSLLSDVSAPRLRLERSCEKVICVAALSWAARTPLADTGENAR
jgi:mannosyltransferase